MGMSASQARLLSITSRMSDVEFKSEQISQSKIRMSQASQEVTAEYNEALSKQLINYKYLNGDNNFETVTLTPAYIAANADKLNIELYYANGTKFTDAKSKLTATDLYDMISSGQVYIKDNTGNRVDVFTNTSYRTTYDDNEVRKAEANYEAELAKINQKEKMLDFELDNLQTEHNALKAEMDSIKSLIKDNVEKSFNIFS